MNRNPDTGATMTLSSTPPSMAWMLQSVNELLFPATADRCDGGVATDSERWEMGADRVGNITGRKVRAYMPIIDCLDA